MKVNNWLNFKIWVFYGDERSFLKKEAQYSPETLLPYQSATRRYTNTSNYDLSSLCKLQVW